MSTLINRLFAHLAWADRATLAALHAATPPAQAVELYAHIVAAERVWLDRLRRHKASIAVWPTLSLTQSEALAEENAAGYREYLTTLPAGALEQEVAYVNSAGDAFRSRADDILLHVCLHGQYHRGQIASLLRREGGTPAQTDFITYVRGVPAATRQPSP